MAGTLVAGRVDENTKQKADVFIRRAGMTTSDVIRVVWHRIAETGEVPKPEGSRVAPGTLTDQLAALRATTPSSEFLENLTPDGLKEELGNRE